MRAPVVTHFKDREPVGAIGEDMPVATLFVALPMLDADILKVRAVDLAKPSHEFVELTIEADTRGNSLIAFSENEPAEAIAVSQTTGDATKSTHQEAVFSVRKKGLNSCTITAIRDK